MKRLFIIASFFLLSFYSCNTKKTETKSKNAFEASLVDADTINKPKTNFSVHKEYDKNGNLISVDSTYSYIYSNGNVSSKQQNKIFEQFKSELSNRYPTLQNDFFDNFFGDDNINDSIFRNNFYSPDYFLKNQNNNIKKMLKQMDSIKNSFYKSQVKSIKKQV